MFPLYDDILRLRFSTGFTRFSSFLENRAQRVMCNGTFWSLHSCTLNLDETNFRLFKSHRKARPRGNLTLQIKDTTNEAGWVHYPGVYANKNLTWNEHISQILNKTVKNVGIIARLLELPMIIQSEAISIEYLLYPNSSRPICSLLSHDLNIYICRPLVRVRKLEVPQKRTMRTIAGIHRGDHTVPMQRGAFGRYGGGPGYLGRLGFNTRYFADWCCGNS